MDNNFSVLMSVYLNTDKNQFIECLDSICIQSTQPSEIIIMKNGELNFNLGRLSAEYKTMNIVIIDNECNLGFPKSLNKGLSFCKNDIVFRMDTDDICERDRFKIQLEKFVSNKNLAVLGTNVTLINEDSTEIVKNRKVPLMDKTIRSMMPYKNPFNHPSVVYRKSFVEMVGGYSNIHLYEDWFLWFKLSKLENVEFENLDQKLLKYRIRTFNDRQGLEIIKAEYDFYHKLKSQGFISTKIFVLNISIRFLVRILPANLYNIFKHRFDEIG